MSNPVAGADYTIHMITDVDLTGATVTIEYRKPDGSEQTGITPTNVNVSTGTISYRITKTLSANSDGEWKVTAKIVDAQGDTSFVNPSVSIIFDRKYL
jgi:hypothetical protein